jgi:hypothetical protein
MRQTETSGRRSVQKALGDVTLSMNLVSTPFCKKLFSFTLEQPFRDAVKRETFSPVAAFNVDVF